DAQAARVRLGIVPRYRAIRACVERAYDGRAPIRLRRDHARQALAPVEPPDLTELGEHLPHADESRAAAGGIDDRIRQSPPELLRQLEPHRLLPFDAIRL